MISQKSTNQLSLSIWQLNLLMSLLFVSLFNHVFWGEITGIINPKSFHDLLFIVSIFLLLLLVINLILNLISSNHTYRLVYILLFMLTAAAFYFISQYNIVIDKEMIRNVMETSTSEAKDLIGFHFVLYLLVISAIPIWLLFKVNVRKLSIKTSLIQKFMITLFSIVGIALLLYLSYPSYASIARSNRHLSHLILPTNFIFASISYLNEQLQQVNTPFDVLTDDTKRKLSVSSNKNILVIMVGETARADRFSLNNYHRPTNPKLAQRPIINFKQTSSCGTSTAISLPCLFSHLNRKNYNHKVGKNSSNLLDFFQATGIDVQWRNNNTGCKSMCDRIEYLDLASSTDEAWCNEVECFDEILLKGLSQQISENPNDQVIVLHQKGSHGPAYHLRYPKTFAAFKPTCQNIQLQKCSQQELDNSYDNTILYTDHVIDSTIALLSALPATTNSALVYISDHGESLGENNLYLHGTPYLIAPEAQTHVPFMLWSSDLTGFNLSSQSNCLSNKSNHPLSHDHFFHSMLGLMDISSTYYQASLDLFASCKNNQQNALFAKQATAGGL